MGDETRRNPRSRAHYAWLFDYSESAALPESMELHELTNDAIIAAAAPLIPTADASFCRKVRRIGAFLDRALKTPPPSEKEVGKKLKQIRKVLVRLQERLDSLSSYTRYSVADLVAITPTQADPSQTSQFASSSIMEGSGGVLQPDPELDRLKIHEDQSAASMPEWELDDPVGRILCELKVFQKRLDARLAERVPGGRPRSPKWFGLLVLCHLIHEYKGSCSEDELTKLAEAYLRPVLALNEDFTGLSEHIQSVVEEVNRLPENGAET